MTSLDHLKLAFAWHIVRQIVGADGHLDPKEEKFLHRKFPEGALGAAGFVDDGGLPSDAFRAALGEAMIGLPETLDLEAKIDLLDTFMDATLADDEFHHEEGNLLVKASRLLGMSSSELNAWLDATREVGQLELPEPE